MAIFNKDDINPNKSETTVISSSARIEGQFYLDSMLHIDGEVNGTIHSRSIVTVGKSGILKGQVNAEKVVVNGVFEGEMDVDNLEILVGGIVNGNIIVRTITIENGGRFYGNSKIKEDTINLIENNNQEKKE